MNLLTIKHWETAAQECCEEYLFQKSPQNYKKTPVKESFSVGASCKLKVFEELKEPLKKQIGELIWEISRHYYERLFKTFFFLFWNYNS